MEINWKKITYITIVLTGILLIASLTSILAYKNKLDIDENYFVKPYKEIEHIHIHEHIYVQEVENKHIHEHIYIHEHICIQPIPVPIEKPNKKPKKPFPCRSMRPTNIPHCLCNY